MAINKNQKNELITELKDNLSKSNFVVIAQYRGIGGKELYDLRVELKSKGCNMKIAKNTLAKIAIKGTEFEILSPFLRGPTAILYSQDPVVLAKIVSDAGKKLECLKVEIAYLDKNLVKQSDIFNLAKLGSFAEVRSSFIGVLGAVQSKFVRTISASQSGFVSLLGNYAKTKQE